jgi:hypothetical protein
MKEIRICDKDSDRVVLEAIMEGVNSLIRAKNEESAPYASTSTGGPGPLCTECPLRWICCPSVAMNSPACLDAREQLRANA